uniref:Uncharacterized protein n=1 Tax=Glossina palpalis gambiensis TaxID=67801 RepID=A0A1B0B7K8_9MUSC
MCSLRLGLKGKEEYAKSKPNRIKYESNDHDHDDDDDDDDDVRFLVATVVYSESLRRHNDRSQQACLAASTTMTYAHFDIRKLAMINPARM